MKGIQSSGEASRRDAVRNVLIILLHLSRITRGRLLILQLRDGVAIVRREARHHLSRTAHVASSGEKITGLTSPFPVLFSNTALLVRITQSVALLARHRPRQLSSQLRSLLLTPAAFIAFRPNAVCAAFSAYACACAALPSAAPLFVPGLNRRSFLQGRRGRRGASSAFAGARPVAAVAAARSRSSGARPGSLLCLAMRQPAQRRWSGCLRHLFLRLRQRLLFRRVSINANQGSDPGAACTRSCSAAACACAPGCPICSAVAINASARRFPSWRNGQGRCCRSSTLSSQACRCSCCPNQKGRSIPARASPPPQPG